MTSGTSIALGGSSITGNSRYDHLEIGGGDEINGNKNGVMSGKVVVYIVVACHFSHSCSAHENMDTYSN